MTRCQSLHTFQHTLGRTFQLAAIMAMIGVLSAPNVLLAGPSPSLGGAAGEVLDPVSISARVDRTNLPAGGIAELTVLIEMSPGWHVNSHKPLEEWLIATELLLDENAPAELLDITYPREKRLRFEFSEEEVAVYEGRAPVKARVKLSSDLPPGKFALTGFLTYQACNDQTCLAPADKPFAIEMTVESGAAAGTSGGLSSGTSSVAEGGEGLKSRLTGSLSKHFGNPLIALLLTFLAGLLSAATPCVYPMIPITARILMGRGGDNPALGRMHALMYFVGIILIYALLGFIAGVTGGGFNEILRIPFVILMFAVLFTLLGLSMLGFFEIQIPASFASKVDSSTSQRSGLLGTTLMGAGAGLVVSPCVGPVVIFILTQIAAQIAQVEATGGGTFSSTGKVVYGAYLMAGYGAGLGIPFLIVGIFSARLAQPGTWMTFVRVALGLVILYFAYDYFHKALATAGVERTVANAILAGLVLIFLAVLWGAFRTKIEDGPHAGWHKVRLASTIIMLVTGIFFLWTGLSRSGIVPGGVLVGGAAPGGAVAVAETIEQTGDLIWQRDFAQAQQLARERSLPIFVDFYAHWCANCKKFGHEAEKPGSLQDALQSVVLAKIYDTDDVFKTFAQDARYPELKRGLPFFLILSSNGEPLWKGTDYRATATMIAEIKAAIASERAS